VPLNDGRRHIVESDELLSAFRELERVTRIALKSEATRAPLLFAYFGKIDLADYLHSDRNSIIGCSDFLKSFHDTSTLESSQRLDRSQAESMSILGRRIGLPKPSPDPDF
jgi:hypothetical protein